jgi:3-hydroxyisobutyrate dehydrogenase-like beta-hydroxyacid dehydrogenase
MDRCDIGLAGYGEVGKVFAAGLKPKQGVASVAAWDLKFADTQLGQAERAHAQGAGVAALGSMAALCAASNLVISAVTASSTLAVAQEAAAHLRPGTLFLDLNSASPGTKQQAAAAVEAAGAHHVEAGVMTSVPPYGIRVPMLLGGVKAGELAAVLQAWGMDARAVSGQLAVASAIKMCRSVMIKGLEALVIESYATARHYGVGTTPTRCSRRVARPEPAWRRVQCQGAIASCTTCRITSRAFFWVSVVGRRADHTSISWLMIRGAWMRRTTKGSGLSKLLRV